MLQVGLEERILLDAGKLCEGVWTGAVFVEGVAIRERGDHVVNVAIEFPIQFGKVSLGEEAADDDETIRVELGAVVGGGHGRLHKSIVVREDPE